MKKIRCLFLALLLLLQMGTAMGEGVIPDLWGLPTVTLQPAAFFFRGGIQWNMSREQVRGLEPIELTERNNASWSVLIPLKPVEVSRYTADLVYMFYEDQLKMIQYDFGTNGSEADFLYLTGALDTVYGEHDEPAASEIVRWMDQIYPTYYKEETILNRRRWTAGDGTEVYLFYYAVNAYTILYTAPAANGAQGNYITTGL